MPDSVRIAFVLLLLSCKGEIQGGLAAKRPRVIYCQEQSMTATQVFESLSPTCVGCHGASAEYKLFASAANFESMVVRNPRFVTPGDAEHSPLLSMLEGQAGSLQMPPPDAYVTLADRDQSLPSMGELRCWVNALEDSGPVVTSAALSRRLYQEHLQRNLQWALGLAVRDFSTGGADYGTEDPDGLSPRSPVNQYRAQQLGAPHWLEGVPRANDLGATFVQITVQLSQAWCIKAANSSRVFYKYATGADTLSTPAGAARIRQNLSYLFERVTGDVPDEQTLNGLVSLYAKFEPVNAGTAWAAACSGIVRHPLSLTF